MSMSQGAALVERAIGSDGSSITAQHATNTQGERGVEGTTMKALTWQGKNKVEISEVPKPKIIEDGDVILKVTGSTVCGSDLHLLHGVVVQLEKGDILGHEFCGVVDQVGPGVTKVKPGERVVASFQIACGHCFYCRRKLSSQCERTNSNSTAKAMYGTQTAGMFGYSHFTGGFAGGQAEYVRVPLGDVNLLKLPDNVPDERGLYLSDVLCTSYHCVTDTGVEKDDVVAIFGAGPIGQMCGVFSLLKGASRIIFIDTEPRTSEIVTKFKPDQRAKIQVIDYKKLSTGVTTGETVVSRLKELTEGRGPDVALECAAGEYAKSWAHWAEMLVGAETDTSELLNEMVEGVRNYGRCGITGVYVGYTNHFAVGSLMQRGVRLIGNGQAPVHMYWEEILKMIQDEVFEPLDMVSHRVRLEDLDKVYYKFDKKEDGLQKVFVQTRFSAPPAAGSPALTTY